MGESLQTMNMNGNTWKPSEAAINFQYMSLRSMFLSSVYGRYMHVILHLQEVLAGPNDGTRTNLSFPHFVRKVSQGKLIQSKPSSYSLGGLGGRQFSECTFLCNYFLIGTENSSCSCLRLHICISKHALSVLLIIHQM